MKKVNYLWENKPLHLIIILALSIRIISAIFAKGYGMHDDHFIVIESSQSWVDGNDYNNWLPKNATGPTGHSFFYPGIHFVFFSIMNFFGIIDPQLKMFFVRLIHALFSLLVIIYGFKITEKLSNIKNARIVGLLLSLLWLMPFLSVRNLSEVVCIPFLMISSWIIINAVEKQKTTDEYKIANHFWEKSWFKFFISGFVIALALSIRIQTLTFIGGLGLYLLIIRNWKAAIYYSLGIIVCFTLTQGIVDTILWGYPYAEMYEYIQVNIRESTMYINGPWYNYILLILGILIPPISIFLFFGFFKVWKKHLCIFLPAFLFFLFHSFFTNKQERFILPVLPFIVLLGVIGWNEFAEKSKFWLKHSKLLKGCWIFFWSFNLLILPFVSTLYSKRARVEAMVYLSQHKDSLNSFVLEDTNRDFPKMVPLYYAGKWISYYNVSQDEPLTKFRQTMSVQKNNHPEYTLFVGSKNLQIRVDSMKKVFPNMKYETTIDPSFVDKVVAWMNPVNANEFIYIYKNHEYKSDEQIIKQ